MASAGGGCVGWRARRWGRGGGEEWGRSEGPWVSSSSGCSALTLCGPCWILGFLLACLPWTLRGVPMQDRHSRLRRQLPAASSRHVQRHRFGHLDAVHARREDAAGIARAFAGGIEPASVQALEARVSADADGRGGARLDAGQHGVLHREARDLPVEGGEGLADRGDRVVRQAAAPDRPAARRACMKAAQRRMRWRRRPARKSPTQLRRGAIVAAAELEGPRFPVALEADAGQRAAGVVGSGVMPTTMPALALRSSREYWLMPLVTTRPGSEVAATTVPPGHMQKL